MIERIKNVLPIAILVFLIVFDIMYIVVKMAQREQIIAEQSAEIAALREENLTLAGEKMMLEEELAIVCEENVALEEEIAYLHYLLDDPMTLFGNNFVELTPEEEVELMQIAMAEAGNQGLVGKMLVMNTVLNRMERDGMSVHEVIYAPNQYYTAGMGGYDEECEVALLMVTAGWDGSQGAYYFCNEGYNGSIPLFRFRGHWFSK